jgi:hypothetical protein
MAVTIAKVVLFLMLACIGSVRKHARDLRSNATETIGLKSLGEDPTTNNVSIIGKDNNATQTTGEPSFGQQVGQYVDFLGKKWDAYVMDGWERNTHSALPVLLGLGILLIFLCAVVDFRAHLRADPSRWLQSASASAAMGTTMSENLNRDSRTRSAPIEQPWYVISLLTTYKVYNGFLVATWVPFLIAKEGDHLMTPDAFLTTASFMGVAKVIYGFSIFLNPFFGLVSDRITATAPKAGRSAFLMSGVCLASVGILAAKLSSKRQDVPWYLGSSCLWFFGEAMIDITVETAAPELLPKSQFDTASALKTVQMLLGSAGGYTCLIFLAHWNIGWETLYAIYFCLMLICAIPTLICIRALQDGRSTSNHGRGHTGPLFASLFEAYIAPARYPGGFMNACCALFVFSMATGPLFFTSLMLRDLVKFDNEKDWQVHFSGTSIAFLFFAVIAAMFNGVSKSSAQPRQASNQRASHRRRRNSTSSSGSWSASSDDNEEDNEAVRRRTQGGGDSGAGPAPDPGVEEAQGSESRWNLMLWSMCAYTLICAVTVPIVVLPSASREFRLRCFYIISSCFGVTFGCVFSRFQTCIWMLIPRHADIASTMGFVTLSKCMGVGIGNLAAGIILHRFRSEVKGGSQNYESYAVSGYYIMTLLSAFVAFLSVAILWLGVRKRSHVKYLICGCLW